MDFGYIPGPSVDGTSPTYQQTQPVPALSGPEALAAARRFAEEIRPGAGDRDRTFSPRRPPSSPRWPGPACWR